MHKRIKIFALINAVIFSVLAIVFIVPMARATSDMRNLIRQQESQYAVQIRLALSYEDNLYELNELNSMRQLLTYEEHVQNLTKISGLSAAHSLRSANFVAHEPVGFDFRGLEPAMELRINIISEGYETDIFNFLNELENTPSNIVDVSIVWFEHFRARISVELSLFFQ